MTDAVDEAKAHVRMGSKVARTGVIENVCNNHYSNEREKNFWVKWLNRRNIIEYRNDNKVTQMVK